MKKFFALFIIFALFIAESYAQPGFDDDVQDAPIPGGGYFFIIVLLFGAIKLYKENKQKKKLQIVTV